MSGGKKREMGEIQRRERLRNRLYYEGEEGKENRERPSEAIVLFPMWLGLQSRCKQLRGKDLLID